MRKQRTRDPRDMPAYSLPEVAGYLALSTSTLREWVTVRGLIRPASHTPLALSFHNLVEAHALSAMRLEHRLSLSTITSGLAFVRNKLQSDRPLLDRRFETDGIDLFIEQWGKLMAVSRHGQIGWRFMLEGFFKRIERDLRGVPIRMYPVVDTHPESRPVAIDPLFSFGRPTISGTGIMTSIVAERVRAGEAVADLADDYELSAAQILSALRYEGCDQAA